MRYPDFLPDGGTIGFVAPSFGCDAEPYRTGLLAALERLEREGFGIDLGPNCFAGDGVGISSSPENCGAELTQAYCSEVSSALISCGGGELMCEILDHVDFGRISSVRPKWFMGYSDNTNFTFLLTTLCNVASIYGPCAGAFGMDPRHPAVQDALDVLRGRKTTVESYGRWEREKDETAPPTAPWHLTEELVLHSFPAPEMTFSGRLIGGCMDCLVNLTGTRFDRVDAFVDRYASDGFIWFLESCDLNVFGIRRAIWQMEHAGWFRRVNGFLIGRPLCHGQELMGLDQYDAVLGLLGKYHVPVVMDADIGHLPPQMPLICGSMARVHVGENHLSVQMNLT